MKRFISLTVLILMVLLVAGGSWYMSKFSVEKKSSTPAAINNALFVKINSKANLAKQFLKQNNYNPSICFLIDMSIESGANRFFVYNLKNDSIINTGLVTHGRCNEDWLSGRRYGNEVGCGCTSLGKYKVGNPYRGKFGLAYKLHGLEPTNSNAFKRYVVLHSHECVPTQEVKPAPICQSDGCPTVSSLLLKDLSVIIDKSDKPVLLWIFE